jgi:hypothetical protein
MHSGDLVSAIVMPILFTLVAIVIVLPWILKARERFKAHETLRYLVDKGQAPPPELLASLIEQPKPRPSGERDLRASIVWLSIAIGVSALGASIAWVADPGGNNWIIAPGVGAFPASIGIGYLLLWILNRREQRA